MASIDNNSNPIRNYNKFQMPSIVNNNWPDTYSVSSTDWEFKKWQVCSDPYGTPAPIAGGATFEKNATFPNTIDKIQNYITVYEEVPYRITFKYTNRESTENFQNYDITHHGSYTLLDPNTYGGHGTWCGSPIIGWCETKDSYIDPNIDHSNRKIYYTGESITIKNDIILYPVYERKQYSFTGTAATSLCNNFSSGVNTTQYRAITVSHDNGSGGNSPYTYYAGPQSNYTINSSSLAQLAEFNESHMRLHVQSSFAKRDWPFGAGTGCYTPENNNLSWVHNGTVYDDYTVNINGWYWMPRSGGTYVFRPYIGGRQDGEEQFVWGYLKITQVEIR